MPLDKPIDTKDSKLPLFKAKFSARLESAAKVRKSHKHISRELRRLDSIARLLEGNAICVAVHYHVPTKVIWIASNKIHEGSRLNNDQIDHMKSVFDLISNEELPLEDIIKRLIDIIYLNINQEKRFDMAKLKKENIDLKAMVTSWVKQLMKTTNGMKTERNCAEDDLEFDEGEVKNILLQAIKITFRLTKDFLKLRVFLFNPGNNTAELAQGILLAIREKHFKIVHAEGRDVHAEMRIVAEMLKEPTQANAYIGISKLCCAHCSLAMAAFDKQSRGVHGQSAKWPLARAIANDAKNFALYVGKDAYQAYQAVSLAEQKDAKEYVASKESSPIKENAKHGRTMQADSSESEVELGFDSSDEEKNKINQFTVKDIWHLRDLKSFHAEEYRRLIEIGVSQAESIALYKDQREKFNAISSKKIYGLILKLAEAENDSSHEIFDKLSALYEEEENLFWDIVNDADDLVVKHSFAEVCDKYKARAQYNSGYDSGTEEVDIYAQVASDLDEEDAWDYEEPNSSEDELVDNFANLDLSPSHSRRNSF